MRFFFKGAAAVAVAALFPIIGSAQQGQTQGPPPPGGGRGMARGEAVRQMQPQRQRGPQLTTEQREQMRTFDEQQRAAGETARRELGDLHRQLNEALTGAEIDNSKITQLRSAIVQRETALTQQRVDRLARIASVLTPEQRQALRGRGIGEVFGRGGPGGRARAMAGPGGQIRAFRVQPGPRGARGEGIGPRQRRGAEVQLRGEIRRLEAQLEALRRRIGR